MTSPYLERPARELDEIAASCRDTIETAAGAIAKLQDMLEREQRSLALAEQKMEWVQEAMTRRIRRSA